MPGHNLVILSEVKDTPAHTDGLGMLGYAQRDMAVSSLIRTRTAGAARYGGLGHTPTMQAFCPGESPRVMEALCRSSN
jgi:hypothetical protein